MAERRAGLGRGLGELFQRTDLAAPPHPVDQHVIVDKLHRTSPPPTMKPLGAPVSADGGAHDGAHDGADRPAGDERGADDVPRETRAALSSNVSRETPEAEGETQQEHPAVDPENGFYAEIPIDLIHPNAKQPRSVFEEDALDELVGSIREVGLLQPIVVREDGEGAYELVMGERRWRASRLAGLSAVPSIVRETADNDMLRDALLENIHRVQLNPLEEASAYQQLMEDFGCTQQELAQRIKRSRSQIANTVRLLNLPPTVQRRVAVGVLSAGHARALLGLSDPLDQERLAQRIVAEGLSVRAAEEIVALGGQDRPKPRRRTPRGRDPRLEELSARLGDYLDTRVEVTQGRHRGKIVVEFASEDDLQRIMGLLQS